MSWLSVRSMDLWCLVDSLYAGHQTLWLRWSRSQFGPNMAYLLLPLGHSQHLKLIQRQKGFHDDHRTSDKQILYSLSELPLVTSVIFLVILYYSHKLICVRQLSLSTTPNRGLRETTRSCLFRRIIHMTRGGVRLIFWDPSPTPLNVSWSINLC